jgi:hypothetical protein
MIMYAIIMFDVRDQRTWAIETDLTPQECAALKPESTNEILFTCEAYHDVLPQSD